MKTSFATDADKISFDSNLLFDRIINLKLKCGYKTEEGAVVVEEFVIRSDYELVPLQNSIDNSAKDNTIDNKYILRRCTYKPSIKVQCNMVTASTGTSIDVFVSNFFIFTSDGKHLLNFNKDRYEILGVEIAMGYWGQFKDSVKSPSDFFDIKAEYGADKIEIKEVTYVTTDKLPPDSTIHIKGFVGNILSSPVAVTDIESADEAEQNPVVTSESDLEKLLFNQITRRFTKSEIIKLKNGIDIVKSTAMMTEAIAKKDGVKVYLSNEAKSIKIDSKVDGDGNKIASNTYFEGKWTEGQSLTSLFRLIDESLTYRITNSGDILVFTAKEGAKADALYDDFVKKQKIYAETTLEKYYKNEIPAVYNINIDAVATIVCPFFTFIEPFQNVKFASRYALSSLVTYFASYNVAVNEFVVIKASLSFATVDNVNEVQITAVPLNK